MKFVVTMRGEAYLRAEIEAATVEEALEKAKASTPKQVVEVKPDTIESTDSDDCWEVFGPCERCDKLLLEHNGQGGAFVSTEDGLICNQCGEELKAEFEREAPKWQKVADEKGLQACGDLSECYFPLCLRDGCEAPKKEAKS